MLVVGRLGLGRYEHSLFPCTVGSLMHERGLSIQPYCHRNNRRFVKIVEGYFSIHNILKNKVVYDVTFQVRVHTLMELM